MILEVYQGLKYQSTDEELIYTITTTNWASTPTSPSVKVFLEDTLVDVTSTVMPTNSPSVSGDVITLSPLKSLSKDQTYRVEVKFTAGGNVWECYFRVKCSL